MTAVYFTTITCKPNTANRHIENLSFFLGGGGGGIRPCTNNILYARFGVFRTLLCVFMSIVRVFVH